MMPTEIVQNRKARSIGSFTAVRNRTMDSAPTMPREITALDWMVTIMEAVIMAMMGREMAKDLE